jgi:hypothetical protein
MPCRRFDGCVKFWTKMLLTITFLISCSPFQLGISMEQVGTQFSDDPWKFKARESPEGVIWGERGNEMFGSSVAIWNNMMIVGAYGDSLNSIDCGAAYVYEKHNINDEHDAWKLSFALRPHDGASGDKYGYSVALDYNVAIVGSISNDGASYKSGSAYLYIRQQERQHQHGKRYLAAQGQDHHQQQLSYSTKLLPLVTYGNQSSSSYYFFGCSIAIHGNTSVVGAWGCQDALGQITGCAFVWKKTERFWYNERREIFREYQWEFSQRLDTSHKLDGMRFGYAVSVFGQRIAIGAPDATSGGIKTGAVFTFDIDSATTSSYSLWEESDKLSPSDEEGGGGDGFGSAVILWDKHVLIGAPYHSVVTDSGDFIFEAGIAYSFVLHDGEWEFEEKLKPSEHRKQAHFGFSLDVYKDLAVIGAYNSDGGGSISIYRSVDDYTPAIGNYWEYYTQRQPTNEIDGDKYGYAVSVYYSSIAVGAYGASAAWESPRDHRQKDTYFNGGVYIYYGHHKRESMINAFAELLATDILVTGGLLVTVGLGSVLGMYLFLSALGLVRKPATDRVSVYQITGLDSTHGSSTVREVDTSISTKVVSSLASLTSKAYNAGVSLYPAKKVPARCLDSDLHDDNRYM